LLEVKLKLLLFLFSAISLFSQTITITGVSYLSYNSARVNASTNIGTISAMRVRYSVIDDCAVTETRSTYKRNFASVRSYAGVPVFRLKPATTYYFCAVATVAGVEYISASASGTTAALPSNKWDRFNITDPTRYVIPAEPTSYGATYTVDPTCSAVLSGGTGGLSQIFTDIQNNYSASTNVLINQAPGINCTGNYNLPIRNAGGSGWIVIKNSDTTTYPPEGVWVDESLWPVATWPKIITSSTSTGALSTAGTTAKIRLIGIHFTNAQSTTTVKSLTSSGTTSTAHGWSVGNLIHEIDDATGGYRYDCKIATVPTSTTYTISSCLRSSGTITYPARVFRDNVTYARLVYINGAHDASNIIIDRCYFKATILPAQLSIDIFFQAYNSAIINSTFYGRHGWCGHDPVTGLVNGTCGTRITPISVEATSCQNCVFAKNRILVPGISFFIEGSATRETGNVIFERNYNSWPTSMLQGHPDWDGFNTVARQPYEQKQGRYYAAIGNIFDGIWCYGETGSVCNVFELTPRPGDAPDPAAETGITHFKARSNTITNSAGFVKLYGGDYDAYGTENEPTKNIEFSNNLIYLMDGYKNFSGGVYWGTAPEAPGGSVFGTAVMLSGVEGFVFRHNTYVKNSGGWPGFTYTNYDHMNGYWISDNIFQVMHNPFTEFNASCQTGINPCFDLSGTVFQDFDRGTNTIAAAIETDTSNYWGNNVLVPGVEGYTNTTINYNSTGLSKATVTAFGYPNDTVVGTGAGGETAAQRAALVGFQSFTSNKFCLAYNSSYNAKNKVTTDGKDAGVDCAILLKDQGYVEPPSAHSATSSAITISYFVHDKTDACYIQYGTTATYGAGTTVADGLTGTNSRIKQITGLSSGTNYYFRLLCPNNQYSISKSTL
jgi:hypothetical protein